MGKIIIENSSTLPIEKAINMIHNVIEKGKVSNNGKQYCYLTIFRFDNIEYGVSCSMNKKSFRFIVWNVSKK